MRVHLVQRIKWPMRKKKKKKKKHSDRQEKEKVKQTRKTVVKTNRIPVLETLDKQDGLVLKKLLKHSKVKTCFYSMQ